jgi:hypothetical protein
VKRRRHKTEPVIMKWLPPFSIAAGIPAKIIGKRSQLPEPQAACTRMARFRQ